MVAGEPLNLPAANWPLQARHITLAKWNKKGPSQDLAKSLIYLEAGVGIEPAYTALQAAA